MKLTEDFLEQVYAIVDEIPRGSVATYGQIARLAGCERNARLVGRALSVSFLALEHPCHRVVNHVGRCAPGWVEQRVLLENEGITFGDRGLVDLKKHQWHNGQ